MIEQVFINELKANFSLRAPKSEKPTNVYLVCRINCRQVKLATGIKVYPEQWNEEKQEAYISCRLSELDNLNNTIANKKIVETKSRFLQFKHYLCDNPNEMGDNIEILKKFIYKDTMVEKQEEANVIHWLRKALFSDRTVKESTRADYVKHIKFFQTFLEETNRYPIGFADVDLSLIKDYEAYLFNKDVGKGKTTKTTTVGNKVEKIISIIKRAESHNLIDIHEAKLDRYKKPQSRQGDDNEIYLTEEEIDNMYALELKDTEEQVRDLFVLQCWIGQRFADTQAINEGIIECTANGKVLEIVQGKKTHKVSIPLLPIALKILDKYDRQFPVFSNQTALIYLKRIGKKAGINRLHNVIEDRGGEVTTTKVMAYTLIGTHTARRSFICNMLKKGYDAHLLMKITGHLDIDSFQKYVKVTSVDAANVILSTESNNVNQPIVKSSTSISKPKQKVKVLDYLLAENSLLKLDELWKQGVNIYQLAETQKAINVIKDIKRANNAKDFLNGIGKPELYERINTLEPIVYKIARHYLDASLYQLFQQKIVELELSNKIKEVTDEDRINELWAMDYADKELAYQGGKEPSAIIDPDLL